LSKTWCGGAVGSGWISVPALVPPNSPTSFLFCFSIKALTFKFDFVAVFNISDVLFVIISAIFFKGFIYILYSDCAAVFIVSEFCFVTSATFI
jgi:hypothetical protein